MIYGEDPSPYERRGEGNFYDLVLGERELGFLSAFPWDRLQVVAAPVCTDLSRACQPDGN